MILRDYCVDWIIGWVACWIAFMSVCFSSRKTGFKRVARHLLDTWWIDWESSCLLDSFSTPSGSIEVLFLDLMSFCSIPQLLTSIFSTPTSTPFSTPLDTSSIKIYWRFYISLLVRSKPHFTWYLSRLLSVFSPKLSHLTPILILKGFFKLLQDFLLLVSF